MFNKLGLALAALAVIVGGYALLTTSSEPVDAQVQSMALRQRSGASLDDSVDEPKKVNVSVQKTTAQAATSVSDDDGDEDEDNDKDEVAPKAEPGTMTEAEAIAIADGHYKGNGQRTDIELETEDGVLVYAVEYTERGGNEVDVKINAKTGVLLKIESDESEEDDD